MCIVFEQIQEAWVEGRLIVIELLEEHLEGCSSCQGNLALICPDTTLLVRAKNFEVSLVLYNVISAHILKCLDCEQSQNNPPPCQGNWPD